MGQIVFLPQSLIQEPMTDSGNLMHQEDQENLT